MLRGGYDMRKYFSFKEDDYAVLIIALAYGALVTLDLVDYLNR